ncbi:MAG: tRNA preQ1(34) S-adenosylmethionine ribosyltransferase-isomerase QueA [Verrucomicrobia bacterium]|nr:tRNA preQ1(34) S-adenosylmethionine ribosyltransferase-isomerase QueA [Verrucomicrobiota bacterium]
MRVDEFDYELPEDLIAQYPLLERDQSRLLVLDCRRRTLGHGSFMDLPHHLKPGDALVINDSRVIPARLFGRVEGVEREVELLLLREVGPNLWECLAKPGRKLDPGRRVLLNDGAIAADIVDARPDGTRTVRFALDDDIKAHLDRIGHTPLPPYIRRPDEPLMDRDRYQTVYARERGSVAAPTAGLHFTERVLEQIGARGVRIVRLTLHVGLGTFQPLKVENVAQHHMHPEVYKLPPAAAKAVNETVKAGRRVFAVGTTAARVLETCARDDGTVRPGEGETDLFITPGYRFRVVHNLLTNFHLPRSTLLMLVCAIAGRDLVLYAYEEAVREGYRFYSYGDAMLILNASPEAGRGGGKAEQ